MQKAYIIIKEIFETENSDEEEDEDREKKEQARKK